MYINIQSQYDIVSMTKRFHTGFYAKCKKMWWNVYVHIQTRATSWKKKTKKKQTNKQSGLYAQRRLRSAWASAQSYQSLRCALSRKLRTQFLLQADSADSVQTGRMPRLIWVFAGRTNHFVGFVMPWLNFHIETTSETIVYVIVTNLHMRN